MPVAGGAVHDYIHTEPSLGRPQGREELFVEGSDIVDAVKVDMRHGHRCVHQGPPRESFIACRRVTLSCGDLVSSRVLSAPSRATVLWTSEETPPGSRTLRA